MGKQSMATAVHSYVHRVDNKLYRIQTPQKPIVQTDAQTEYEINDYPTGTNAVVAVISYTGYDMEDAMIINKSTFERGFGHGTVYKTEVPTQPNQ
jgi:DNA-directed RNA polymerase I subunit RPA2